MADLSATISIKKQPPAPSTDDTDRKKRSEEYKARLKKLLENMPKEEDMVEEEVVQEKKEEEEEKEEEKAGGRMRLPVRQGLNRTPIFRKVDVKKVVEIKLPAIVEEAMKYAWFPKDQFFQPEPETIDPMTQGQPSQKLKVEPEADTIAPIILDVFRNATDPKTRLEVVQHLNWMYEEYGFRDASVPIARCFARYLQADANVELDAYEMQLRVLLIDSLARFNANYPEMVPTLLLQIVSPHEEIRTRATDFLRALGVRKYDSPYIKEAVEAMYSEVPPKPPAEPEFTWPLPSSTPSSRPTSASTGAAFELRNLASTFVRQNLKNYLIRTTPDREVAKTMKVLTPFGLEDKDKKKDKEGGTRGGSAGSKVGSRPGTATGRRVSGVGSRPASALGAVVERDGGRRVSTVVGVVTEEKDGKVSGETIRVMEGEEVKLAPASFDTSGKGGKEAEKEKGKKHVIFESSHPTTPLPESGGPESQPDAAAATAADASAGGGVPLSGSRPSTGEGYDSHLTNIVTNRLPAAALAESFPEDSPFATLTIDRPPLNRNPITILQNPTSQDFINALNYHIIACERVAAHREKERLDKLRMAAEEAERLRLEEEKKQKYLAYVAQKEAERVAKAELRKRRLEELRRKKEEDEKGLPKLKVHDLGMLRTKGVGLTHRSVCHPSRETLDVEFRKFPPWFWFQIEHSYYGSNDND
ncbi:hypothetical protein HK097_005149 [Rhizophlyctis rosea]|uniref:Uncharacterized protein n=1 Tax=Rhizophlyctis rosea TaxID=64517 RepID=A0AAD5S806_9FUNG|nr:hypothetical protein HK097_005149 [Rhizophlyctis rosea]